MTDTAGTFKQGRQPVPPDTRPLIALTMGDAAGIGPELVVRAATDESLRMQCRMVAVGHPAVLQRAVQHLQVPAEVSVVPDFSSVPDASPDGEAICGVRAVTVVNPCADDVVHVLPGAVDARSGQAAYECLVAAARAALSGTVAAVTTAPLNKAALHAAGRRFPGHTEILAEVCGVTDFGMMLYLPGGDLVKSPHGLGVVHTTLHTSIRSVPELLSADRIAGQIRLMDEFMRRAGAECPHVAVCALNPHAGEGGLFGDEESRIIRPAVELCAAEGLQVSGPLPADALLRRAVAGEFDGVVAMYHDQGHIALKLIGFDRAVNITLGLPIIRTSPSHGTAFDIAWRQPAAADGMIEAIRLAAVLATGRNVER